MTAGQSRAVPLGGHDYLVRVGGCEATAEIRVHASADVMRILAVRGADEVRVVEATVTYLVQRQRADDLPISLDLDDVAAAYTDYVDAIRRQLGPVPPAEHCPEPSSAAASNFLTHSAKGAP